MSAVNVAVMVLNLAVVVLSLAAIVISVRSHREVRRVCDDTRRTVAHTYELLALTDERRGQFAAAAIKRAKAAEMSTAAAHPSDSVGDAT